MANALTFQFLDTPIGRLRLVANDTHLLRVEFDGQHGCDGIEGKTPVLTAAASQLAEYFAGQRQHFRLPLHMNGTLFQEQVWTALQAIPYGACRSYQDIARAINRPRAVRAVGAANGRNPLPIIVPCHRVVGSNGKLTGFAGGLASKALLIKLEANGTSAA